MPDSPPLEATVDPAVTFLVRLDNGTRLAATFVNLVDEQYPGGRRERPNDMEIGMGFLKIVGGDYERVEGAV